MIIYYYSGTGNSLWTARTIAAEFQNARIATMIKSESKVESDTIGFVFPVHMWGVPRRVIEFVNQLHIDPETYCFAVAVNAGQVSGTLVQFKRILQKRGPRLALGRDIVLASNYIPWGGPGPEQRIRERIAAAREKIASIVASIRERETAPVDKGPWWQRILFTAIYKMSFKHVPAMDKRFFVEDTCNSCGVCEKVCIADNIRLVEGKPVWGGGCEQCLACIQWCPQQAIQYGPKTSAYQRYHHPDITVKMMIESPRN